MNLVWPCLPAPSPPALLSFRVLEDLKYEQYVRSMLRFRLVHDVACFSFASDLEIKQISGRAAFMAKIVDSLLRGRAQPSARHEAAAAVSDVRAFVRAWRTKTNGAATKTAVPRDEGRDRDARGKESAKRPPADVLLKLAQVRNASGLRVTDDGVL